MGINQPKQRTWRLASLAVASLLTLGACADADVDGDLGEAESLEQVGAAAAEPRQDLGKGNGQDVVTIGDSWMSMIGNGDGIEGGLRRAGTRYRNYGVLGTQLLNGQIPGQFDQAVRQNRDIKTVIMTGGGNDVLLNPVATAACRDPSCGVLKNIVGGLTKLWEKMAAAGVKDVVYMGYSEGAGSSPPAVTNATKNGAGAACQAMTSLRCHVIDSTPIVRGQLGLDGIHPIQQANDRMAKAILELMEKEGIRR
jgi:hypothetical protein